jgi:hypothetical protein
MQAVFCTDHSHLFPGGQFRTPPQQVNPFTNYPMTDDTLPDLRLILRNTENAARDSQAALDAATRAEILLVGVIPRL